MVTNGKLSKASVIKNTKRNLARLFKSRCFICHKPFGKGFAFHHKWYDGGEPEYKLYNMLYWNYVFNQIRTNPKQFRLLCKAHHYLIDRYLKRMADAKFRRVCQVRRESK